MHQRALVMCLGLWTAGRLDAGPPRGPVTFQERVAAEEALQRVYHRHRIWPESNPLPRAGFEERFPSGALAERVRDYLRMEVALERRWNSPVTASQIQAELDRISARTRDARLLRDLFTALDDDVVLIGECLIRPMLVRRRIHHLYCYDRGLHEAAWRNAREARADGGAGAGCPADVTVVFAATSDGAIAAASPARPRILRDNESVRRHLRDTAGPRLRETDDDVRLEWLIQDDGDELTLGVRVFAKVPFDTWWSTERLAHPVVPPPTVGESLISQAALAPSDCDRWQRSSLVEHEIEPAQAATAVWTGSEMIVWGGYGDSGFLNVGGIYDPATDTWRPTSRRGREPSPRGFHTAVWTGSEMIVWGGDALGTGGRYDPASDTWQSTSTQGAPTPRNQHTAVWTGAEMIVWGGRAYGGMDLDTGARYDPVSDSWRPTSTGPAVPQRRSQHGAVWTGTKMIVWGGQDYIAGLASGARYDPATDSWAPTATAGAPPPMARFGSVWTGAEMIVWGSGSGGRYDPIVDSWLPTSSVNAPAARTWLTAVWSGSEMIVWGGQAGLASIATGGRYDPATDSWMPTSTGSGVPSGRRGHVAVWTGSEMVVWGGDDVLVFDPLGGRYDPATDTWRPTSSASSVPIPRIFHSAVWTGTEMIVWGGTDGGPTYDTGGRYTPALDAWEPTAIDAATPSPRNGHAAVWTGNEMVVWGGGQGQIGGRYDPAQDSWRPTAVDAGTPSDRWGFSTVWTGAEMIVWGGIDAFGRFNDGARYDPVTDAWTPTSTGAGVPSPRAGAACVWTGTEMIVWGGTGDRTGGRYDPVTDTWRATRTTGAAEGRVGMATIWTGSEMIVWGGYGDAGRVSSGGRYRPTSDSWTPTAIDRGTPAPREFHTASWAGGKVIVWGGLDAQGYAIGGSRYDPATDSWAPMATGKFEPERRMYHTVVSTGSTMIVWGGGYGNALATGGIYAPSGDCRDDYILGLGHGSPNPSRVRVADPSGTPTPVDFLAYGTGAWGVNLAGARIKFTEILTGPGPGPVHGPQVRAFDETGDSLDKVNFYAYGTPRFGVDVAGSDVDADGYDEVLTGAGPSQVFGPHVRGWNYDGIGVTPISGINFFAYATLSYGVNVAAVRADADAQDEILTGPGPGAALGAHVRGWDYDGAGRLTPLPGASFFAYANRYGVNVAGGDVDGDLVDEVASAPGAGPTTPPRLRGFEIVGTPLTGFDLTIGTTSYGGQVALGDVTGDGVADLVAGLGPDPSAAAAVHPATYDGASLTALPTFDPYPGSRFGVHLAGARLGY